MKYKNTLFMGNPLAKRCLTLAASLFFAFTSIVAQRSYTFNAVALNVDGLPNKDVSLLITTINVNPDGKNEDGATASVASATAPTKRIMMIAMETILLWKPLPAKLP